MLGLQPFIPSCSPKVLITGRPTFVLFLHLQERMTMRFRHLEDSGKAELPSDIARTYPLFRKAWQSALKQQAAFSPGSCSSHRVETQKASATPPHNAPGLSTAGNPLSHACWILTYGICMCRCMRSGIRGARGQVWLLAHTHHPLRCFETGSLIGAYFPIG